MPLYRLEVKKRWGVAEYGNRYFVNAADQAAAATIGGNILEVERQHTWDGVTFLGTRVSTAAADGRTGRTYPVPGASAGAIAIADVMPIEVCVKINFYPGVKQPGSKYYHFALGGPEQVAGLIDGATFVRLLDFAADLLALGVITDQAGVLYTQVQPETRTHIHQMYRAWAAREGADIGD